MEINGLCHNRSKGNMTKIDQTYSGQRFLRSRYHSSKTTRGYLIALRIDVTWEHHGASAVTDVHLAPEGRCPASMSGLRSPGVTAMCRLPALLMGRATQAAEFLGGTAKAMYSAQTIPSFVAPYVRASRRRGAGVLAKANRVRWEILHQSWPT